MNTLSHVAVSLNEKKYVNADKPANLVLREIKKGQIYRLSDSEGRTIEGRFMGGIGEELIFRMRLTDKTPSIILAQAFRYRLIAKALKAAGLAKLLGKFD